MALSIPYGFEKRNIQFIVSYMITRAVMLCKYTLGASACPFLWSTCGVDPQRLTSAAVPRR